LLFFAFNLILVLAVFTFNACQPENIDYHDTGQARNDFLATLSTSREAINKIGITNSHVLEKPNNNLASNSYDDYSNDPIIQENTQTVCFAFNPNEINLESQVEDTNTLGDALNSGGNLTSIDGMDINNGGSDTGGTNDGSEELEQYCFEVPVQPTQQELDPVVQEARNYLYSKGFTNNEIDDMVIDEDGQEEDLIALAAVMTSLEDGQNSTSSNFRITNLFFNSAYAQSNVPEITPAEVGTCAMIAIGADVLWALGGSSASSWTKKAMKKAFGAVAKRMLGPIGVAIAVVTFGICLAKEAQD
jgi:hypothetical protein